MTIGKVKKTAPFFGGMPYVDYQEVNMLLQKGEKNFVIYKSENGIILKIPKEHYEGGCPYEEIVIIIRSEFDGEYTCDEMIDYERWNGKGKITGE